MKQAENTIDARQTNRLSVISNRTISVLILMCLASPVVAAIQGRVSLVGVIALGCALTILAYGHWRVRLWAATLSGAISWFAVLLGTFYLVLNFEHALMAPPWRRAGIFGLLVAIAIAFTCNYLYLKRDSQRLD